MTYDDEDARNDRDPPTAKKDRHRHRNRDGTTTTEGEGARDVDETE